MADKVHRGQYGFGLKILTYNDASEIRHLYVDYPLERVTVPKVAPNSKETEGIREYYDHLIIRNYAPSLNTRLD